MLGLVSRTPFDSGLIGSMTTRQWGICLSARLKSMRLQCECPSGPANVDGIDESVQSKRCNYRNALQEFAKGPLVTAKLCKYGRLVFFFITLNIMLVRSVILVNQMIIYIDHES